jgi:hypothetical protein
MNSRTRNSRSELRSLTYDSEGQSGRRRRRTTIDGEMASERSGSRDPETGRWKGETESTRWTTTTTLSCGDGRLAGAGGGERERRHRGGEAEPRRLEGDEDEAAPRGAAAAGKGNKWLGLGQRGAGPWGQLIYPVPNSWIQRSRAT